jgi:hypothetical protein
MVQMHLKKSMKSSKSSIKHIYINGQEILFPDKEDWKYLFCNPLIDNMPIALLDSVKLVIGFSEKYPEINLGLGLISIWKKWMPYIFLTINSNFQRVHLEKLTCKICGWQGMTANPMIIDPYLGDGINQDYITLMKYAEKYPILKCPQCNSSLPRHPIWIEYSV